MGRGDHEYGWQTSIFILTAVQQELCVVVAAMAARVERRILQPV
jgi:hypothetical protein